MPRSETIYGVARGDSAGDPLQDGCSYRVSGGAIDTRWWSVTAYRNSHWMPNALPATRCRARRWPVGFVLVRMLLPTRDDPELVQRLAAVQAEGWAKPVE